MALRELTLLNPKGGTGKTTLAAALGVRAAKAGRRVMMIDTDGQASLLQWAQRRTREPQLYVEGIPLSGLGRRLGSVRRSDDYDLLIIDTHGSLSGIEPAVTHASLIVIPIQPSGADLPELPKALALCHKYGRETWIVGNRVKTTTERAELPGALQAMSAGRAKVAQTMIADRVAYRAHFLDGLAAEEIDKQAHAEIVALAAELDL